MPEAFSIWLIEHGPSLWPFGLLLCVLSGAFVTLGFAYSASRKEARKRRARMGESAQPPRFQDGQTVVLSGKLQCPAALCERFENGSPAAAASVSYKRSFEEQGGQPWESMASAQAPALVVTVGNTNIIISGPLEVLLGSTIYSEKAVKHLPKHVKRRIARSVQAYKPFLDELSVELHSLSPGDLVRVRGRLISAKVSEGGTYRSQAAEWRLLPAMDENEAQSERIELAFEGTPRFIRDLQRKVLRNTLLGALTFGLLFLLGGEVAFAVATERVQNIDYIESDRIPKPFQRDEVLSAIGISSLSPVRKHRALEDALWRLDFRRDEDPSMIELRSGMYQLLGKCSTSAAILMHQGFFGRGAELTTQCGSPTMAVLAFFEQGEFQKASAAWLNAEPEWPVTPHSSADVHLFAVELHLLAGEFSRAAAAANRLSEGLEKRSALNLIGLTDDPVKWRERMLARRLRCLADALDARAGDKEALARLADAKSGSEYLVCAALRADLLEGDARISFLNGINSIELDTGDPRGRWLSLLSSEADPMGSRISGLDAAKKPERLLLEPGRVFSYLLPAVESRIAARLAAIEHLDEGARTSRDNLLFSIALFDYLADGPSSKNDSEIADPDKLVRRKLQSWVRAVRGDALAGAEPYAAGLPQGVEAQRFFELISAGHDGERIHQWLRVHGWSLNDANSIVLYHQLIKTLTNELERGRNELLRWVRWGVHGFPFGCRTQCHVATTAALAQMAEQLGDAAYSIELRARIAPLAEALRRRDIAIPLAVLGLP